MAKQAPFPLKYIDIDALLALPKCPPLVTVESDRHEAVKYAIYQYVNVGEKITVISNKIQASSYVILYYWMKKYNVYEIESRERKSLADPRFMRTKEFCLKCKEHYDAGNITYTSIARLMNCDESTVTLVAKQNGWASNRKVRKFKWAIPENLPINDISKYSTYKSTIYHFSKKMIGLYFSDEQKALLATKKYHVDHNLSIYEAFNRDVNPLHWSLVCHPANLQILSIDQNLVKGRNSGLNPKELKEKIIAFELTNGKVLLPLTAPSIPKYSNRLINKRHFTFHYKKNNN